MLACAREPYCTVERTSAGNCAVCTRPHVQLIFLFMTELCEVGQVKHEGQSSLIIS